MFKLSDLMKHSSLIHMIILLFSIRFLAATGARVIYPLAPFLEEKFDLLTSDIGLIFALSEISAIPALFIAMLADKYNIKVISFCAFALLPLSFVMISFEIENMFLLLLTSRIMFVFGYQIVFTTSLSVLFGTVSEEKKLKAATLMEFSWGGSALIAVPLLTSAFKYTNFTVIFLSFALILFICTFDILYKFPKKHHKSEDEEETPSFKEIFHHLNHISVHMYNLNALLVMLTNNGVFILLSFLLRDEHEIEVSEVGLAFFIVGLAEAVGVVFLAGFLYKFNLKQTYLMCYIASFLTVIVLFSLSLSDDYSILLLQVFIFFFLHEVIIVFTIAETESYALPKYRSSVLSIHAVLMFVGRSVGVLLGERIYTSYGLYPTLILFSVSMILSILFLRIAVTLKRTFDKN